MSVSTEALVTPPIPATSPHSRHRIQAVTDSGDDEQTTTSEDESTDMDLTSCNLQEAEHNDPRFANTAPDTSSDAGTLHQNEREVDSCSEDVDGLGGNGENDGDDSLELGEDFGVGLDLDFEVTRIFG